MMDEDDDDHSYHYLINSIDKYQQKTRKQKNLDDLAVAIIKKDTQHTGGRGPKGGTKGLAANLAEQCRFHLSPTGCRSPDTCSLGRHDPECQGKGSGKGGGKDPSKGKPGKGKASGGKGNSKGGTDTAKGGKGDSPPQHLPDDALVDTQGRPLCYNYVHGKCTKGNACKRYHGPATPAMTKKRLADEKAMADKKAAGGQGTQTDTERDATKPKAKAKGKNE